MGSVCRRVVLGAALLLAGLPDNGGKANDLVGGLHRFAPHVADWQSGNPTWQGGKGIVGALNYLAGKGMNSVYFLTMNVAGDGLEVYPWSSYGERFRFDCSKLDQWEIVLSHMDVRGLLAHVVTQEQENDQLLDGGQYDAVFHDHLPFIEMVPADALTSSTTDYCLAKAGQVYAVYLPAGGTTSLNLAGVSGTFDVRWFDPRNGGALRTGTVAAVTGGGTRALGLPPVDTAKDWVALVRRR